MTALDATISLLRDLVAFPTVSSDGNLELIRYVAGYLEDVGAEVRVYRDETGAKANLFATLGPARDGGIAHNVIPGHCTVDWEMRPVQGRDGAYVKEEMTAYVDHVLRPAMQAVSPSADILTHVVGEVDGLEPVADSEAVRIVSELTGANAAEVVSFGTEAGLYQGLGISTVVCGPGSIEQARKPDEYVTRDQLDKALGTLAGLTSRLKVR